MLAASSISYMAGSWREQSAFSSALDRAVEIDELPCIRHTRRMDDSSRRRRQDLLGGLEYAGALSAAVVSASFILGTALLLGRCVAIGFLTLDYISVSDALNGALIVSPIALGEGALALIFMMATTNMHPQPASEAILNAVARDPFYVSRTAITILIGAIIFAVTFLPTKQGSAVIFIAVTALFMIMNLRLLSRIHKKIVSFGVGIFAVGATFFFLVAVTSYMMTAGYISQLDDDKEGKLAVELCADNCAKVHILMRLAEVMVVRHFDDGQLMFVPNSQIKKIDELRKREDAPLVDLYKIWQRVAFYFNAVQAWVSSSSP